MYLKRTLGKFIQSAAKHFPVLMVTGARQVGKTTFLRQLSTKGRTYVTLDDPLILSLAKEDPALFFQKYSTPLLIDEIQYAPELLTYIKMEVDKKQKPNLFWLTGSQPFYLMQGVSESLAGRIAVLNLSGLSRREYMEVPETAQSFLPTQTGLKDRLKTSHRLTLKMLYQLIWRGSLPAIVINQKMDWQLFYQSYLQTYLQRDIRDLARVGDEMTFLRFLRAAAARTGQLLNIADLARDADVAPNTAKHWLSILQISGIIYLLEPFHKNLMKRMVKMPKLYFLDTGLAAYLTDWSNAQVLEAGAMAGAILETWIINELLKSYWHQGQQAPFYYYRDKDKKEIDLLIVRDGKLYPLEFKKTASPKKEDIRHFQVLEKFKMPIVAGGIICLQEELIPLTDRFYSIPISVL